MRSSFQYIALTPSGVAEPAVAIAATRAGALGVLNCETISAIDALEAAAKLARFAAGPCGLRFSISQRDVIQVLLADLPAPVKTLVLSVPKDLPISLDLALLRSADLTILWEVTNRQDAQRALATGLADGLIAKGHETGGWVGEETSFILLQRLLRDFDLPIYAYGGIGLHTAAACYAAGAAGVVLDHQLALARESRLPQPVKDAIARMDGTETYCIGAELERPYRVYMRPDAAAAMTLQKLAISLGEESDREQRWQEAIAAHTGWGSLQQAIWPIGQDAALAAGLAGRHKTVGGILTAFQKAVEEHMEVVERLRPLDEGSALALDHNTRYPIVQGPMTRVSDRAEFAFEVAEAGALPFLALALMRGPEVEALLQETKALLGPRPWGVGILGFVPMALRQEQLAVIRRVAPPYAIIAGGRPDQAQALEDDGIATYLHVPSPGLLRLFVKDGARRFIFEGRECGGHVGPLSSFVLWNSMCDVLLETLDPADAADCSVLFAGGIHDRRSAAMVAAMAATLAERGVRIGVLMGTAYLFTHEAVTSTSILPTFQEAALLCDETVLLESGPGHATRCVPTPFVETFNREKRRLQQAGTAAEEIRHSLEELNIGRLRIASKGITRNETYGQGQNEQKYVDLDATEQRNQGMYMIGQVAALRQATCSIAELHHEVAVEGSRFLEARPTVTAAAVPAQKPSNIAIIGMGGFLPKANNLREFWANILDRVDAITRVPAERWDASLYYDADRQARDKIYSQAGGFLDDLPFNPLEFGIPPTSLRSIDPMHLLALLAARDALADAGYAERPFDRSRTSVILGASGGTGDLGANYLLRSGLPLLFGEQGFELAAAAGDLLPEWTEDSFAGLLLNVAAGRIANRMDFGGLNYTVDAACASSLAAVHLAVKELETHNTDMVLVGGVDTVQNPFGYLCFSKTQALSPTGEPRVFDASGDGIVISEGVVILALKRLEDAERDGDRIYAVIQGVGASSDGRAKGMTAPRPEGQALALQRAYAKAGFSPTTVGYFEAHGTGTVVGDQTEARALSDFLKAQGARQNSHAIGSVKSMIGHTKASAGVAGVAKMAQALYHKVLPPTLRVAQPNPRAGFGDGPLYVNAEARPWLRSREGTPRRAGVSAFGFGGTNFHTVLEEYTGDFLAQNDAASIRWPTELFLWPRLGREALLAQVQQMESQLADGAQPRLADLAYSLWRLPGEATGLQLAIVAGDIDDLCTKLAVARAALAAPGPLRLHDPRGIYLTEEPLAAAGKVAFLFPGQGSQYPNMLRDLAIHFVEVRETFEAMDEHLAGRLATPLSSLIFPPSVFTEAEKEAQRQALTATQVAQPAIGSASAAMQRLLGVLGVHGDLAAGHSYGEYTALYAAGVFDAATLAHLSAARGQAIVEAAQGDLGTMAAVRADSEDIRPVIDSLSDVWIANLNAPGQTIISGSQAGIAKAVEMLAAAGMAARPIPVACAFHSPLVAPAQQRLASALEAVAFGPPQIPVYSNTTAQLYPEAAEEIRTLLSEHLVQPVYFSDEIEAMYADGARLFVEVGPNNVQCGLVDRILGERPHLAVAVDSPHRHGLTQIQHALGMLAAHGVAVSLDRLFDGRSLRRLQLDRLAAEAEPALPPTTWFVNGARVRPGNQRAERPQTPPFAHLPILTDSRPPVQPAAQPRPTNGHSSTAKPALPARPTAMPAPQESDPVLASYQHAMGHFLETQRGVLLSFLTQVDGTRPAFEPPARPKMVTPAPIQGQQTVATAGEEVPRSLIQAVRAPSLPAQLPDFTRAGAILITDDGGGVAQALAERIRQLGGQAVLVAHGSEVDLSNPLRVTAPLHMPERVAALAAAVRKTWGTISGILHLSPLQRADVFAAFDLAAWQERLALETKSLFYLARAIVGEQTAGAAIRWVAAATHMDGSHGYAGDGHEFSPGQGGLNGLVKSLAQEWPETLCKIVDSDPQGDPRHWCDQLLAELATNDGLVEIGYRHGQRYTLRPALAPLAEQAALAIQSDWVLLNVIKLTSRLIGSGETMSAH